MARLKVHEASLWSPWQSDLTGREALQVMAFRKARIRIANDYKAAGIKVGNQNAIE
jgi:hypothetical protein